MTMNFFEEELLLLLTLYLVHTNQKAKNLIETDLSCLVWNETSQIIFFSI